MYSLLSDDGIRSNIRRYLLVVEADGVFVWVFGDGKFAVIVLTIENKKVNELQARTFAWVLRQQTFLKSQKHHYSSEID